LYRGTKYNIRTWKKLKVRENRKPRDTGQYTHDRFDEKFKKRFGWPARSESVMAVSHLGYASVYAEEAGGNVAIFLPTNGFKFIWSPKVEDFFVVVKNLWPGGRPENRSMPLNKFGLDMFRLDMITVLKAIDKEDYIKEINKAADTDEMSNIVADAIVETYTNKHLCEAVNYKVEIMFECDDYYLVNSYWAYTMGLGI
ncbi:hypothetical protein M0R04_16320, partial [Candidatus Dojkabacteria bacterium]|nr:hypothetical protein [Candidatus Dojkabacteria bacterium]